MQHLAASIGPLDVRFSRVEFAVFTQRELEPFMRLPDGTEVAILRGEGAPHLVIDHRGDPSALSRIELWESGSCSEGPFAGLLVLADAVLDS